MTTQNGDPIVNGVGVPDDASAEQLAVADQASAAAAEEEAEDAAGTENAEPSDQADVNLP